MKHFSLCKRISVFMVFLFLLCAYFTGDPAASDSINAPPPTSIDSTGTWTNKGPCGGYINNFSAAPSNANIIYAGGFAGVYKSTDGGATWNKTNAPDLGWDYNRHDPGNPDIAVHPTDPNTAYVGTYDNGIYKTTDGGINWTAKGIADQRVSAIAIHPTNPNIVLAGTGDWFMWPAGEVVGIYKSINGGDSWDLKYEAYEHAQVNTLLFDPSDPTRVYAGLIGDNFARSTNTGESWSPVYSQLSSDVYALAATPAGHTPSTVYANSGISQGGELYKSTDQGLTWTKIPHPSSEELEDGKALAVDPNSPNLIYLGFNWYESGVVVYDATADTWSPRNTGLPTWAAGALHIYDNGPSALYVAFERGGLYKSTDGGVNWAPVAMKTPTIADLAVHPTSPGTVIASLLGNGNQTNKTTDSGGTWTVLAASPNNIGGLAYDPNNALVVWAGEGMHNGWRTYFYQSIDGGANWTQGTLFNSGSYVIQGITDLWIDPNDSTHMIFAVGSHTGGGIYLNNTSTFAPFRTFTSWTSAVAADPDNSNLLYLGRSKSGYVYKSIDGGVNWSMITPSGVWVDNVNGIVVDANHHVYAATDSGLQKWEGVGITWTKLSGLPTDDITAIAIDRSTTPDTIYVGTDSFGIHKTQNGGTSWTSMNFPTGWNVTKIAEGNNPIQMVQAGDPVLYAGTEFGGVWIQGGSVTKEDFLGTFSSQGVYCRNSDTGGWVKLASPADKITCGDLDNDGLDDLIGVWPGQGGVWARYSSSSTWVKLSSTADWIGAGDMNGDSRDDLVGTWGGQGVFYKDAISGNWIKLASPANKTAAGDLDGDGIDDLIGIWPTQGGVWVKYSISGTWTLLSSTADWIDTGDMNGDGREDLLGSWSGNGVFYRDSLTGSWILIGTPAAQITAGDLDGDGTDDLIGIWAGQGGVWAKYSSTGGWGILSTTADWIACGEILIGGSGASDLFGELDYPVGGSMFAPSGVMDFTDLSEAGPGGRLFRFRETESLVPQLERGATSIPGPGQPGFRFLAQENLVPGKQVINRKINK